VTQAASRLEQLLDLVQVLRDGSAFYAAAAGEADAIERRDLLRLLADTKTLMARDLVTLVPAREADTAREGATIGAVRDAYIRCRIALRARHDGEFARALLATERRVLDALWDALCAARDPSVQHVLERQYGRAVQAHERIRDLLRTVTTEQFLPGRAAAA